jgi:hypothetical protein
MYAEGGQGAGGGAGDGAGSGPAGAPASVREALAVMDATLDYLNGPGIDSLEASMLGDVLQTAGGLSAKFAAFRASALARFAAAEAHNEDGYGSPATWLTAKGKMTRKEANAQVKQMRQLRDHPELHKALVDEAVSESWATEIGKMTDRLPAEVRDDIDRLLVATARSVADLADLAMLAQAAYEAWRRSQGPDDDGDGHGDGPEDDGGFGERFLRLGTTLDGVGRLTGNLTPECAESVQAVLDALGKKAGTEDGRTEGQRYHDAIQMACELLIRAGMVPGRKGADTKVEAVVSLSQLLDLPGASAVEEAWLAGMAGEHGYLTGKDAEVIACDALIVPVITGHPDLGIVDQMIGLLLDHLGVTPDDGAGAQPRHADDVDGARAGRRERERSKALSPKAWQALRYAIAKLAIDLVSGPGGLASALRRSLLDAPYNGKSVILDIGYSDTIPPAIRRAVQLRAKGVCEWPGCRRPGAWCDVHHIVHKKDGGETSVRNCAFLCQFHHDVCIHRSGWRFVLHPDATTSAYGPGGQELHSHGPPGQGHPAGNGRREDRGHPAADHPQGPRARDHTRPLER